MILPDLLILRHGETEWNAVGRMQGALDSALTATGRAQAAAMGDLLCRIGVSPATHAARISPLGRTRTTAEIALGPLGLGWVEDRHLVEIDMGDWSGLTRDEIVTGWNLEPDAPWFDLYERIPNGESLPALMSRAAAALAAIDRPTVIVTHGVTSRALRAVALGLGLDGLRDLPGGQGVIHRVRHCQMEEIWP